MVSSDCSPLDGEHDTSSIFDDCGRLSSLIQYGPLTWRTNLCYLFGQGILMQISSVPGSPFYNEIYYASDI